MRGRKRHRKKAATVAFRSRYMGRIRVRRDWSAIGYHGDAYIDSDDVVARLPEWPRFGHDADADATGGDAVSSERVANFLNGEGLA